jgi:hypothetical protein
MKRTPSKLECYYWGIVLAGAAFQFEGWTPRIIAVLVLVVAPFLIIKFSPNC